MVYLKAYPTYHFIPTASLFYLIFFAFLERKIIEKWEKILVWKMERMRWGICSREYGMEKNLNFFLKMWGLMIGPIPAMGGRSSANGDRSYERGLWSALFPQWRADEGPISRPLDRPSIANTLISLEKYMLIIYLIRIIYC